MLMVAAPAGPPAPIFKGLLLIIVTLFSIQAWVSCGESDNASQALLKFKSSLSYAKAFDTWNQASTNPCSGGSYSTWHGVLCYNGDVWGLQLENMGLTGQIDVDSLVPLHTLRSISLMRNAFEGPMPDWRKLGALKSLFLSDNNFSGQIQDVFSNMTSLKKVYLANNKFTGNIPLSLARPRLLELRMENNGFTGTIPNLRQGLRVLNLSNNQLEGPIPQSLNNFSPTSFAGNKDLCGKPLEKPCLYNVPDLDSSPIQPQIASSPGASLVRIIIIVIAGMVAVAAILVLLAICGRSRREASPQLGWAVSSSPSTSDKQLLHITSKAARQVGLMDSAAAKSSSSDQTNNNIPKKSETSNKLLFVREDRQKFDLQDLLRASAEVLGSGNFGSSYKALLMDGQALVVKRFKQMNNVGREDFHEHMRRLGRLVHPNLLPLVAYYYRKEEKLLVYDYVQNGSLASHLHGNHSVEKPALNWPTRLKIIKGVVKGLGYLHSELPASLNTPHGHLKSSNVVLDKSFQPLLMDYGLVPVVNQEQVPNLLVAYKSPEYIRDGRVTRKSDVWNLGILILEILTSKFPTNYLTQDGAGYYGSPASSDAWASFVGGEDHGANNSTSSSSSSSIAAGGASSGVFDAEMGNADNSEGEMRKLLKIGMACCEEDEDKRLELKEAIEQIEAIKERDDKL